jgi:hypothetical protein
MQAEVSNRSPHLPQDQRFTTSRSLTNSDQSGINSISPHFTQVVPWSVLFIEEMVAMLASLLLLSASRVGSFFGNSRVADPVICIDTNQIGSSFQIILTYRRPTIPIPQSKNSDTAVRNSRLVEQMAISGAGRRKGRSGWGEGPVRSPEGGNPLSGFVAKKVASVAADDGDLSSEIKASIGSCLIHDNQVVIHATA